MFKMTNDKELKNMLKSELVSTLSLLVYEEAIVARNREAARVAYQLKVKALIDELHNCVCMHCKDDRRWMLAIFLHHLQRVNTENHLPEFHVDTNNIRFVNPDFERMTRHELITEILRVQKESIEKNIELVQYVGSLKNQEFTELERKLNALVLDTPKKAKKFAHIVAKAKDEFVAECKKNSLL